MGKADVAAREYLSDPARFADLFNHGAFGGAGLVDPRELRAADSASTSGGSEGRRDLMREWARMEGCGATYALLGVEEQTAGHPVMPARCALYDAMAYAEQVRGIAGRNRREGMPGAASEELLSGVWETDRLRPVVTLVLYLNAGDWGWPETLHDTIGEADPQLMALVPDYRVNLVVPARVSDDELDAYDTELGLALKYVKHSKDGKELGRMVREDARYRSVGADTASFVNAVTGSRLRFEPDDGRVDMCKAIDDMRAESKREGMLEGMRMGRLEGAIVTLRALVEDGIIAVSDAAAQAGMTVDEFEQAASELALS
ncbi:MAG: hypothetical protein J6S63_08440 [Atopobiaceae bacterium]|nr:hypothetical protein [Atopobiaceae bacterium]